MTYQHLLYELSHGVARVTLNRPDVLNSFNAPMARELQAALRAVAADDAVRAVLLTGAGRGFCAGQDLAEVKLGEAMPDIGDTVRDSYNPIVRALRTLEKPVVCAVNGVAAGAGANLALACDIVLAADTATFIQSFSKIGLIPDSGGTYVLPRLVGMARATALAMLGDKVTAEQALAMGMIYQVYPAAVLLDAAAGLATTLAAQPTRGLGLIKRALNASLGNSLDAQLQVEEELQRAAGRTEDFREGVKAFLEKRKARFVGR